MASRWFPWQSTHQNGSPKAEPQRVARPSSSHATELWIWSESASCEKNTGCVYQTPPQLSNNCLFPCPNSQLSTKRWLAGAGRRFIDVYWREVRYSAGSDQQEKLPNSAALEAQPRGVLSFRVSDPFRPFPSYQACVFEARPLNGPISTAWFEGISAKQAKVFGFCLGCCIAMTCVLVVYAFITADSACGSSPINKTAMASSGSECRPCWEGGQLSAVKSPRGGGE